MYLLDLWRGQASSDVWITAWCDLVKKGKPLDWAEEQGQISAGLGPFIEREATRTKAYVNREQFPTRGDKAVRAQSIRGRMAMGGLYCRPGSAEANCASLQADRGSGRCRGLENLLTVGTLPQTCARTLIVPGRQESMRSASSANCSIAWSRPRREAVTAGDPCGSRHLELGHFK
jgi:hypothetical protein